jgi:hypothetical protein
MWMALDPQRYPYEPFGLRGGSPILQAIKSLKELRVISKEIDVYGR